MSPGRRDESGIPHARRTLAELPGRKPIEEQWDGANEAKAEKLRRNNLERRARACGLRLRHSDYGYALIDPARDGVEGRKNMTLDDVESRLDKS